MIRRENRQPSLKERKMCKALGGAVQITVRKVARSCSDRLETSKGSAYIYTYPCLIARSFTLLLITVLVRNNTTVPNICITPLLQKR